jgi:hypothetical protein
MQDTEQFIFKIDDKKAEWTFNLIGNTTLRRCRVVNYVRTSEGIPVTLTLDDGSVRSPFEVPWSQIQIIFRD